MNITFFRKVNDPRIELARDLIEELDELYNDVKYVDIEDRQFVKKPNEFDNENNFKCYEEMLSKIAIRESVIKQLLTGK